MATQEISSGGFSQTVPGSLSSGASGTTSVTSVTNIPDTSQYADAIVPLQPIDPNSLNVPGFFLSGDPFNLGAEGLNNPNGYVEKNSPGYQQYGDIWTTLLNSLNNTPTPDVQNTETQLGVGTNPNFFNDPNEAANRGILAQAEAQANPLTGGINNLVGDTIQPAGEGAASQIISGQQQGNNFSQLSASVLPTVASTFGLDPSSPEAQQYADAFTTYVLQSNNYSGNKYAQDVAHDSGSFENIFGQLGGAVTEALAGGVFGSAADALDAADTVSGAADTAGDALSANDVLTAYKVGQGAIGLGQGIASGNPTGIASGLTGLAGPATSISDSTILSSGGTTGSNAPASAGITSGIANTLGISPDDLNTLLGLTKGATTAGGVAIPLFQGSANAPNNLNLTGPSAPPSAAATAPSVPGVAGTALEPETLDNPAAAGYTPPAANSATLGGGLTMQSMLRTLGEPV